MVAKTLIFYALAVVVAVLAIFAVRFVFKRRGIRLMPLHMFLGCLGFVAMLVLMMLLVFFTFSKEVVMSVTGYIHEGVYKVLLGALFFSLISAIRYFALNFVYFNRGKTDEGESFLAGFGICGSLMVSVYSLYMFLFLASTANGNKLLFIDENGFAFADGAVVPAFGNSAAIPLVTVVFLVYTVLCLIIGEFMTQHAKLPYKRSSTATVYSITAFCELIMCCTVLFSISKISTVAIIIISVIVVALAGSAVFLLYKYKEELPYEKQFD